MPDELPDINLFWGCEEVGFGLAIKETLCVRQ